MADHHESAVIAWLSFICTILQSLIACHVLATLAASDRNTPTGPAQAMPSQAGHVTEESKAKYSHSFKISVLLVCFGSFLGFARPVGIRSGLCETVFKADPAMPGSSQMMNLFLFAIYASSFIWGSAKYSTTFHLALAGALSGSLLVGLHIAYYVISQHATKTPSLDQIQVFGLMIQVLGFLLHPRRPDSFVGRSLAGRFKTTSVAGFLAFSWESDVFETYKSQKVSVSDLPLIDPSLQTGRLMDRYPVYNPKGRLWIWLWKVFYMQLAQQWCLAFLRSTAQLLPQYILFCFLHALEDDSTRNEGLIVVYAIFYGLGLVIELLVGQALQWFTVVHFQIPMQAVLSSLIYRKTLKLPNVAESQEEIPIQDDTAKRSPPSSLKSIDTHLQMDTGRLSVICSNNVQVPQSIAKLVLATTVVARLIGWNSLIIGISCMCLSMALSSRLSSSYAKYYFGLMKYRDQRSNLLSEVLQGIRHIRLGAYEQHWENRLLDVRQEEMKELWRSNIPMCLLVMVANLGPLVLGVLPISLYALQTSSLSASVAFTTIGLLEKLHSSLSVLPLTWTYLLECWASCERLEAFLKLPERKVKTTRSETISFETAIVSWSDEQGGDEKPAFSLKVPSFSFPKGKLSLVTGGTGSGKNLLLSSILGEVSLVSGVLKCPIGTISSYTSSPRVAVVSQQPWLERVSLRENILYGSSHNAIKYNMVLKACSLERDVAGFPAGDETDVGPKGTSLSGGQRWRVCLARALYSEAETIITGDILSAIDPEVRKHVLEQALCGELTRGRTMVLATHHDAMCRPHASFSVHLSKGRVMATESISGAVPDIRDFATIDKHLPSPEADVAGTSKSNKSQKVETESLKKTDQQFQKRTAATLAEYISAGGFLGWASVIAVIVVTEAALISKEWWLKHWTDNVVPDPNDSSRRESEHGILTTTSSTLYYICGYVFVSAAGALMLGVKCLAVYIIGYRASTTIFRNMVHSLLRSSLDWIETVPRGQVLKRFTSDMITVDLRLPTNLGAEIEYGSKLMLIIATGVFITPYTGVCVVCLLLAYWRVSRRCMPIAQQLQRLNSTALSPLYSHLHSTLAPNGLLVIRAFGRTQDYINHMDKLIDDSTRASWYSCLCSRWMEVQTGTLGVIFQTAIALGIVSGHLDAGLAGFALAVAQKFSATIDILIRKAIVIQNDLGAASRVSEYNQLPVESQDGQNITDGWPQRGEIVVQDLTVGYGDLPPAVENVNFSADPGQRIGIVGRTGAGKSTLALAFFRVLEPRHGSIIIDGVDISTMKLKDLRGRICIIPQDPFLFSGTLRSNLDVLGQFSDKELTDSLKQVQLDLPLDSIIATGGSNISQGQRQLVCLARALLTGPKMLILDEATSAIDMSTDVSLQRVMRERFPHCTMMVIAHRLSTIVDFDKIVVLSDGKVVETGRPAELAGRGGKFCDLIDSSSDKQELYRRLKNVQ